MSRTIFTATVLLAMFLVKENIWKKLVFIFIHIRSCRPSLGKAGGRAHQCLLSAQSLQADSFQKLLQGWCGYRLWGDYREQLEAEFSGETEGQPLLQSPFWRPLHCILKAGGHRGLPSSLSCSSELCAQSTPFLHPSFNHQWTENAWGKCISDEHG